MIEREINGTEPEKSQKRGASDKKKAEGGVKKAKKEAVWWFESSCQIITGMNTHFPIRILSETTLPIMWSKLNSKIPALLY